MTQAHIDARAEAILAAAQKLFGEQGIDRTTMQEIAAAAGISAGAIYRYFPSKDALLEAVHTAARGEIAASFAAAEQDFSAPLEALIACGQEAIRDRGHGNECALWLECILAALRDPDSASGEREVILTAVGAIESLLQRARSAGDLAEGIDIRAAALLCYAAAMGLKMTVAIGIEPRRSEEALSILAGALCARHTA